LAYVEWENGLLVLTMIFVLSKMKHPYQISKVVNITFLLEVHVSYTVEIRNCLTKL